MALLLIANSCAIGAVYMATSLIKNNSSSLVDRIDGWMSSYYKWVRLLSNKQSKSPSNRGYYYTNLFYTNLFYTTFLLFFTPKFLLFVHQILKFRKWFFWKKLVQKRYSRLIGHALTPFFNWVQTSVRLCGSRSQKILGTMGLVLKLRKVKSCSPFFSKIIGKKSYFKILCLIDIVNYSYNL